VLQSNREAHGVGISLPEDRGGHEFRLEHSFRARYKLHQADLLYYKLHTTADQAVDGTSLISLPPSVSRPDFDLVILDGHQLRTYCGAAVQDWDRQRLLISQLVIALQAVKHGGTLVIKLSHPEYFDTALLLVFLDAVAERVVTRKPRTIHANRGTFYAIARGVGIGQRGGELDELRRCFEDLWYEISFGGEEGKGRFLGKNDLDFIMTEEELLEEENLRKIVELGRDPWTVQADTLEHWFQGRQLL
jgi:hypothetical protein